MHGLNDISQILQSLDILQVPPKHCCLIITTPSMSLTTVEYLDMAV
jgi:hypothetical protein